MILFKLKYLKKCSCGKTYSVVFGGVSRDGDLWFNCECKSTLFIPKEKL